MMQRRHFLSCILAAGIAPAILSQGSAMRLWVLKPLRFGFGAIDCEANQIILLQHKDGIIAVAEDESALVSVDPHGVRGFINGVPWAPRIVIYNETWMRPTATYPT